VSNEFRLNTGKLENAFNEIQCLARHSPVSTKTAIVMAIWLPMPGNFASAFRPFSWTICLLRRQSNVHKKLSCQRSGRSPAACGDLMGLF
jgi:hypothetical protein